MPGTSKESDKVPDAEADDRFDRAIKIALATPHQPHKAKGDVDAERPVKASANRSRAR